MSNGSIGGGKPIRIQVIFGLSFIWHVIVLQGLGRLFYNQLLEISGKSLSRKNSLLFRSYFSSTIHSTVLTIFSSVLYYEIRNWSDEQKLFGFHDLAVLSCELFLAYLVQDVVYLLYYYKELQSTEALIHHIGYILISTYTLPNSYFVHAFMWLSLGEASTPFLAFRWYLSVLDLKDSFIYKINGIVFTFLFFIVRVVIYGYGLSHLWNTLYIWWPRTFGLPFVFIGLVLLYVLNLYWFTKILRGAMRSLSGNKVKKE